jgi:hypothetical protein
MPNKDSHLKSLGDVSRHAFRKYNGVVLMRKNTGWQIYETDRWHPTWEDAVKDIDERSDMISKIINQSIIKPK